MLLRLTVDARPVEVPEGATVLPSGDAVPLRGELPARTREVRPGHPGRGGRRAAGPDYPFVLNTGRLLYHWHGGTITRRVPRLLEHEPRLRVAIHPLDDPTSKIPEYKVCAVRVEPVRAGADARPAVTAGTPGA